MASMPPRPGIFTSMSTTSGSSSPAQLDGLFARCCLACHLDVRLSREEAPHPVAEEGMVVGDQDAQLLQRLSSCRPSGAAP